MVQGNTYRPNVVRIGSEEAPVSERAKHVWVDGLIKGYMAMDADTWDRRQVSGMVCGKKRRRGGVEHGRGEKGSSRERCREGGSGLEWGMGVRLGMGEGENRHHCCQACCENWSMTCCCPQGSFWD